MLLLDSTALYSKHSTTTTGVPEFVHCSLIVTRIILVIILSSSHLISSLYFIIYYHARDTPSGNSWNLFA